MSAPHNEFAQENEIQLLDPLILPTATKPVEGYDAGIPVRAREGGLLICIYPWLHMDIGDRADVFWGDSL